MSESIEFPEHAWKERQKRPSIEVCIDFLPEKFKGNWHRAIHMFTYDYIQNHRFDKVATIWMWGCMSSNLISRHPDNPSPSWSDFLIQFGLPATYWDGLGLHLDQAFGGQCGKIETMQAISDDGWTPICHIEQGKVWTRIDADTWAPFVKKSTSKKS